MNESKIRDEIINLCQNNKKKLEANITRDNIEEKDVLLSLIQLYVKKECIIVITRDNNKSNRTPIESTCNLIHNKKIHLLPFSLLIGYLFIKPADIREYLKKIFYKLLK